MISNTLSWLGCKRVRPSRWHSDNWLLKVLIWWQKCQHEGLFMDFPGFLGLANFFEFLGCSNKTFQIRSSSLKGVKLCQLGWNLEFLRLLMLNTLNTLNSRFVILKILEFYFEFFTWKFRISCEKFQFLKI